MHPASSWDEHETRSRQLYEEARTVGLIAEKFMLDGRHVGTGGGNHVVMGAANAEDSPFLRRPDRSGLDLSSPLHPLRTCISNCTYRSSGVRARRMLSMAPEKFIATATIFQAASSASHHRRR